MNQPAHTKPVQTDFLSTKPNRRKRLALRFAVLVAAVSLLGAAYWFTRPPELVWWTSPPLWASDRCVNVLIPQGWQVAGGISPEGEFLAQYSFRPVDRRPRLLCRLFPSHEDFAQMRLDVDRFWTKRLDNELKRRDFRSGRHTAIKALGFREVSSNVNIYYQRTNLPAFNRTYRQICNSLRIE